MVIVIPGDVVGNEIPDQDIGLIPERKACARKFMDTSCDTGASKLLIIIINKDQEEKKTAFG